MRPHGLHPTRLLCPWDFPGKSAGVGCHCLLWFSFLQCKKVIWFPLLHTISSIYCLETSKDSSWPPVENLGRWTRNSATRRGLQRRQWHPTPVLLPGKSHGWRSLVGCSPRGREESDMTERLHFHFSFHALKKEMATHCSVFAWRIPGMAEPGGLPSMGSHRAGHD